ncbi:thiopeptide-type bacteriocin biosynthesis protein [Chryseobacterium scophthalmum]|uniref:thiopeptide-type bacteriocin biosynthesis protein n=1 Tax=Chryseobacterium scophthalmum TaxID=59733 RepID=UPI000FBE5564
MKNTKWISAHIYYTELDVIIQEALTALTDDKEFLSVAKNYFFIRYWERGPHIRLRVLVNEVDYSKVILIIENHFSRFFKEVPSLNYHVNPDFFPNNSIQYIDYLPEIKRYGGGEGIIIAEEHFYNCSEFILRLLKYRLDIEKSMSLDNKLILAVRGNLMIIRSMELSKDVENEFILRLSNNIFWKKKLEEFVPKDQLTNRLDTEYEKNSEQLKNLYCFVVETELDELDKIYFDFYKHLENTKIKIDKNILNITHVSTQDLYASYLHMFNNRIGLRNHEEYYLYYMIKKTFNELFV